ncbi:MAG: hypothetical protein M3P18_05545, partial [Actinomycetota bacterium]|nr:hypothetical protein [Actinomycetota bacterium]
MNPALVGRKSLHTPARRHESGLVTVAVIGLAAAVVGLGVAQSKAPENRPLPTPSLQAVAGAATLGTTLVEAPPASFGFRPPVVSGGSYVLHLTKGAAGMSAAQAQRLFAFYLDAMSRGGWTLQAKGDPGPAGDWTLRWQHATTAA